MSTETEHIIFTVEINGLSSYRERELEESLCKVTLIHTSLSFRFLRFLRLLSSVLSQIEIHRGHSSGSLALSNHPRLMLLVERLGTFVRKLLVLLFKTSWLGTVRGGVTLILFAAHGELSCFARLNIKRSNLCFVLVVVAREVNEL